MRINKRKIDKVSIEWANNLAIDRIERAKLLIDDPKKVERNKKQECVVCFYLPRFGGASMTTTECAICSKEMSFGSTAVDIICYDCANKNNLCKCCGADIDLKNRRKPRSYEDKS